LAAYDARIAPPPTPRILVFSVEGPDIDLRAVDTVRAAEGSMEVPEMTEGLFQVFDAGGRQAELGVERWDVQITKWSAPMPERLRALLEAYLGLEGIAVDARQPLSDLIETAGRVSREREVARIRPRWLGRLIQRHRERQS
jgi:hypothetical protein